MTEQTKPACPISIMLSMLGDRWSLKIMRDSIFWDKRRYREFQDSATGISSNILASRLKQLQQYGLLEKLPDPSDGKALIYMPTERGLGLVPILLEAIRWGVKEFPDAAIPDFMRPVLEEGAVETYLSSKRQQLQRERATLRR